MLRPPNLKQAVEWFRKYVPYIHLNKHIENEIMVHVGEQVCAAILFFFVYPLLFHPPFFFSNVACI